jgi:hypothetical protein
MVYACVQTISLIVIGRTITKHMSDVESHGDSCCASEQDEVCSTSYMVVLMCIITCYGGALVLIVLMAIWGSIHWIAALLLIGIAGIGGIASISERFTERRSTGGLPSASMVALYATLLLLDSTMMERTWWLQLMLASIFVLVLVHNVAIPQSIDDDTDDGDTPLQHIRMMAASAFATILYVGWNVIGFDSQRESRFAPDTEFVKYQRPLAIMWIEGAMCVVSMMLHVWFVIAPTLFPEREFME